MKEKPIFALVDCNNFYVSCERVFAPHIENTALVVLSNNDGCAIARSNEAKALGIKMGEPFYKFKHLVTENKLKVLSSNFELYSDMSRRVMQILQDLCPAIEIYSVDEAFLNISSLKYLKSTDDYTEFACKIKQTIAKYTGLPVSVGIAPSKTLAKLANNLAKKNQGVFNLVDNHKLTEILAQFEVEEIWGVGRRSSEKLRILGIGNALSLSNAEPKLIRKYLSITGERMVYELQGNSCLKLTTMQSSKQSITTSRSFANPITTIETLEEALSNFAAKSCFKLRKQQTKAQSICVYLSTNKFSQRDLQYKNSITYNLPEATSDDRRIIHFAKKCLQQIYKPGFKYHKLGIILFDIEAGKTQQLSLFNPANYYKTQKSDQLMQVLDKINRHMGKNSVLLAAQGSNHMPRLWQSQSSNRSPRYTTNWQELPICACR